MNRSTLELISDHLTIRRVGTIAHKCAEKLIEEDESILLEEIEILYVIIMEFIDRFHHIKEEDAYFPKTNSKEFSENIRKFIIEHQFGRNIANMLQRELMPCKKERRILKSKREPIARFLKTYSIFISDHTEKEDKFFETILNQQNTGHYLISEDDDNALLKHYERCKNKAGGKERMDQMIKLIKYLEEREWMHKA